MQLNIQTIALLLVIVGAINWGIVAYNGTDLVKVVITVPQYERYVKYVVAAAGVFLAYKLIKASM
jgi:uncharacterized membrane protein YuzA (DUF378 family)